MNTRLIANRYALLGRLGAESNSVVHLAQDAQSAIYVAVKTPALLTEYHLLATLSHPQVPTCYGYYREAGTSFLIMEWIHGEALADYLIRQEWIDLDAVHQIMTQLFVLFQMLAEQDPPIAYQDLHAGNLMRTADGKLVLIDFGRASRLSCSRKGKVGAYSLLTFLDYSLLPYLSKGATQHAVSCWYEQWRARLWHGHPLDLDEVAQAWHHLIQELGPRQDTWDQVLLPDVAPRTPEARLMKPALDMALSALSPLPQTDTTPAQAGCLDASFADRDLGALTGKEAL